MAQIPFRQCGVWNIQKPCVCSKNYKVPTRVSQNKSQRSASNGLNSIETEFSVDIEILSSQMFNLHETNAISRGAKTTHMHGVTIIMLISATAAYESIYWVHFNERQQCKIHYDRNAEICTPSLRLTLLMFCVVGTSVRGGRGLRARTPSSRHNTTSFPRRRSQWPSGLRHELFSPAPKLRSWVRICSVCVFSVST
jgi:hypothetical protein